jgi:tetratricopeptide (TPR) repeat protein
MKSPGAGCDWLLALGLLAAVLLAYQPAWNGKPVWDDADHLTAPALRSWNGLERIWFQPGATPQYYPLVGSVFWLEQKLWGDAPPGYHFVNILLHLVSALLLVKVLRRLEVPGAWLGAALWALHPVQAESVAWMSELKNTLSGLCYLGSALAYLRFDHEKKGAFYVGALALFAVGLLAKSVIATLPAALLLVIWWQRKKLRWREDVLPLAPFFIAGIGLGLFTAWMERTMVIGIDRGSHLSLMERCLVPGRAVWFYLGKLAWPHPLIFIYPRWEVSGAVWWQYLFPAAALLLAAGLWHGRRSLGTGPLVTLLFFAGTLFPALGFLDVYPFRYSFVADHFQYLACLGPLALAGAGIERGLGWVTRGRPLLKPIGGASLLTALGALTWIQCLQYADVETLWRATLARNPGCWMAQDNLGAVLLNQGRTNEAADHLRLALQINPNDEKAHNSLGLLLSREGELDAAITEFRKALDILPDYPDGHNGLGNALSQKGEVAEAIVEYRKLLDLHPNAPEARINLGNALSQQGELVEAIAQYRIAQDLEPNSAEVHNNLGNALSQKGEVVEAIAQYRKALEIRPGFAAARNGLGSALMRQGEDVEGIAQFRKALDLQPDFSPARNNLRLALFRKGDFDGAMDCLEKIAGTSPAPAERWLNLGKEFFKEGHLIESIACYRQAAAISPRLGGAWAELGTACFQNRQYKEAVESWQKALEIDAAQPQIQNSLAWVMATATDASLRDGAKAVALAEQANNLTGGGNPAILCTLAAAYAEAGRYDAAVATAGKALAQAEAQSNNALAGALQEEIRLYEAGRPMRGTQ